MAEHIDEMRAFYEDVLGFRVTDTLDSGLMVFLRCNRRHHGIALINVGASGLNHLMFEVSSIDDVGAVADLVRIHGQIAADLGRHGNDDTLSFYAWSPSES
jgi:3,4-dihydroxy-9,10-secoandrosta-1,3,5(10)-triene-9,17-dione 4,5-dioxygenase